jgi:hypothetical protein
MKPRVLTILGATATIGVNTLDVVARHPERFEVFALTGATQVERMLGQCRTHRPRFAVMSEPAAAAALRARVAEEGLTVEVLEGAAALIEVAIAPEVDTLMAAIVGAAGLPATLAAAQAGKRILLANKETLVVSGQLFMDAIAASGAELLPIDSEHNAIFQSLPRDFKGDFQHLRVAIVGDLLHSRVARSDIHALTTLGVPDIRVIAPLTLLPSGLSELGVRAYTSLAEGLRDVDVVIMLRLQNERMRGALLPSPQEYFKHYGLTEEKLRLAAPNAIVMHPGPMNRGVEIDSAVADGAQSVILSQVTFGIAVRMAVMSILNKAQP